MKSKSSYKGGNQKQLLDEEDEEIKFNSLPKDLEKEIDSLDENFTIIDQLKKLAMVRNRDILKEITSEYERKGNFVRILPARGSDIYDKYFQHQKQIQRYIYKCLFEDEIIK